MFTLLYTCRILKKDKKKPLNEGLFSDDRFRNGKKNGIARLYTDVGERCC